MGIFGSKEFEPSSSKQDNQGLENQLSNLEKLISTIVTRQEGLNNTVNDQSRDVLELQKGKEEVEKLLKGKRFSQEGSKNNDKIRKLEEENQNQEKRITYLEEENQNQRTRITYLEEENYKLGNEIGTLNHRLQLATRKKPVQVYIYAPSMNERISTAVRSELQDILTRHLEATRDKKLETVSTSDAKMVPSNKPFVVLCINASRLGTDVEQALQNVACSRSVVVAVIHHKEIHALPPQASEKLLYGDKFRELRAIVDIAFLTNKGMYACDMNNRALERLTDFICEFDT